MSEREKKPTRRRSRGEETRASILAAAELQFAERGFSEARLEDIAASVGIRRAAIFYHFSDKQELYAAVLAEVFSGAMAALPTDGSAAERLEASMMGWVDYVAERPSVARLILREAANAQPGARSSFTRAARASVEWFRGVIDEGVASGELRPRTDPQRLVGLWGATTVFQLATMPWLTTSEPWSRPELEKLKRDILLVARHMLGLESSAPGPAEPPA